MLGEMSRKIMNSVAEAVGYLRSRTQMSYWNLRFKCGNGSNHLRKKQRMLRGWSHDKLNS